LGGISILQGNYSDEPNHADAHYTLGVALIRQGKLPEAIAHCEQALRIQPDDAEAQDNLAWARVAQ